MDVPLAPGVAVVEDAARKQLPAALIRIAAGDRAALTLLYRDTSAKLFAVCLRILKVRGEAEDVLQEIYPSIWQRAGTFDAARASPMTWLVAIARNRSIDRLRSGAMLRRVKTIDPNEPMLVAGEYVLGVLSAAERKAFDARLAREPELRRQVEYWEQRLGGLAAEIRPVDPPPHVWANVQAALAGRPARNRLW